MRRRSSSMRSISSFCFSSLMASCWMTIRPPATVADSNRRAVGRSRRPWSWLHQPSPCDDPRGRPPFLTGKPATQSVPWNAQHPGAHPRMLSLGRQAPSFGDRDVGPARLCVMFIHRSASGVACGELQGDCLHGQALVVDVDGSSGTWREPRRIDAALRTLEPAADPKQPRARWR